MLSRTLRRTLLDARSPLPPTFLLPWTASFTTASPSASHSTTPSSRTSEPPKRDRPARSPTTTVQSKSLSAVSESIQNANPLPPPGNSTTPTPLPPSVQELLPLLRAQSAHYITVHIHGHPYLVTQGDTIRLPFLMHGVEPGDVLRLNRAINLGSRDFTLKAPAPPPSLKSTTVSSKSVVDPVSGQLASHSRVMPEGALASTQTRLHVPHFVPHIAKGKNSYIDDRLFVCRAVVMGVESEPMRTKEKTKRRQRHVRRVKSKHRYTILKIKELRVKSIEEAESGTD